MKNLILFTIFFSTAAFAVDQHEIKRLAKIMGGKTLSCEPVNPPAVVDPRYRGDDGYFKLRIQNKTLEVFDHGGYGFGFANGDIRDLHVGDEDLFLSVGDDGYQILTLHHVEFGEYQPDCAEARLISYFDGYHSGGDETDALKCCLK